MVIAIGPVWDLADKWENSGFIKRIKGHFATKRVYVSCKV